MTMRNLQILTVLLVITFSTALAFDPVLLDSTQPVDNADEVYPGTTLIMTFNQAVVAGPGMVNIYSSSDDVLLCSLSAADAHFEGVVVTLEPDPPPAESSGYYLLVDNDAFGDGEGNFFPGITDSETWTFSTSSWFTEVEFYGWNWAGVAYGGMTLGDCDADGDMELFIFGGSSSGRISRIFVNRWGAMDWEEPHILTGSQNGNAAWVDYDGDNDLDLLRTGYMGNEIRTIFSLNDGLTDWPGFDEVVTGLPGVGDGGLEWGDFDNDGDLDLMLAGRDSNNAPTASVFRNEYGEFTDIQAGLQGIWVGGISWGDYDNDADLDLVVAGNIGGYSSTRIYRNDGGLFVDSEIELVQISEGSVDWGDYDSDGDLDLIVGRGNYQALYQCRVYRNDNGTFTDIEAGIDGCDVGEAIWGDMDNDGDLDVAKIGYHDGIPWCRVYRNVEGVFTPVVTLERGYHSSLEWSDFDNDGDLDLLRTGSTGTGYASIIYLNNCNRTAQAPAPPGSPTASLEDGIVSFNWTAGNDDTTPAVGLSYNLRFGLTPGGGEIRPAMSRPEEGKRQIFERGPIQGLSYWLDALPTRRPQEWPLRYWALQSVDAGCAGSPFSEEQSLLLPVEYIELMNQPELQPDGLLFWVSLSENTLESYQLQIGDDLSFDQPLIDQMIAPAAERDLWQSVNLDQLAGYGELQDGGVYYWRMRPHYSDRDSTVFTAQPPSFIYRTAVPQAPEIQIGIVDGMVMLSWQAVDPSDPAHYNVYYSEDPYASFPDGWSPAVLLLVETTWTDTQSPEAQRFYRVTVVR